MAKGRDVGLQPPALKVSHLSVRPKRACRFGRVAPNAQSPEAAQRQVQGISWTGNCVEQVLEPFKLNADASCGRAEKRLLGPSLALMTLLSLCIRRWCEQRGRQVPPPPLSETLERLVAEWFELVDSDRSGALDTSELEVALKAVKLPCTHQSIDELIRLMDFNGDRQIDWSEFHAYISSQVHRGQDLVSGDLVLPSGLSLPLGLMIRQLRRKMVMRSVFKGGSQREQGIRRAEQYVSTMKSISSEDMLPRIERQASKRLCPGRGGLSSSPAPPSAELHRARASSQPPPRARGTSLPGLLPAPPLSARPPHQRSSTLAMGRRGRLRSCCECSSGSLLQSLSEASLRTQPDSTETSSLWSQPSCLDADLLAWPGRMDEAEQQGPPLLAAQPLWVQGGADLALPDSAAYSGPASRAASPSASIMRQRSQQQLLTSPAESPVPAGMQKNSQKHRDDRCEVEDMALAATLRRMATHEEVQSLDAKLSRMHERGNMALRRNTSCYGLRGLLPSDP